MVLMPIALSVITSCYGAEQSEICCKFLWRVVTTSVMIFASLFVFVEFFDVGSCF